MKIIILSIKLTVFCMLLIWGLYLLSVLGIAKIFQKNTLYSEVVGQKFESKNYFWSRPSIINYDASGSSGSNYGPSNTSYHQEVQNHIDTLLKYHPTIRKSDIPIDMITYSGSGLDPNISIQGAKIQIGRIAENRNLSENELLKLINSTKEGPLLGLFGPEKINVLALNKALDKISKKNSN